MYPILFTPIIKTMIWGSESWEITCRPQEMGVVENGEFAGEAFARLCEKDPQAFLGTKIQNPNKFPLLIKTIDARDALSVQVHPDDEYARSKGETDTGKSEMWYILSPPNDGYLIIGLKDGVTREALAQAYENNTVEDCLNRLNVQRGDIVNIPAGLIHALTPGTRVAEIQQNSDITYRLYDFGRVGADGKPRPLHVKDALAVTDFQQKFPKAVEPRNNSHIIRTDHFTVEKLTLHAPKDTASDKKSFSIYTCVEGQAVFKTATHSVLLNETRSAFIPAALGKFTIIPQTQKAIFLYTQLSFSNL